MQKGIKEAIKKDKFQFRKTSPELAQDIKGTHLLCQNLSYNYNKQTQNKDWYPWPILYGAFFPLLGLIVLAQKITWTTRKISLNCYKQNLVLNPKEKHDLLVQIGTAIKDASLKYGGNDQPYHDQKQLNYLNKKLLENGSEKGSEKGPENGPEKGSEKGPKNEKKGFNFYYKRVKNLMDNFNRSIKKAVYDWIPLNNCSETDLAACQQNNTTLYIFGVVNGITHEKLEKIDLASGMLLRHLTKYAVTTANPIVGAACMVTHLSLNDNEDQFLLIFATQFRKAPTVANLEDSIGAFLRDLAATNTGDPESWYCAVCSPYPLKSLVSYGYAFGGNLFCFFSSKGKYTKTLPKKQ